MNKKLIITILIAHVFSAFLKIDTVNAVSSGVVPYHRTNGDKVSCGDVVVISSLGNGYPGMSIDMNLRRYSCNTIEKCGIFPYVITFQLPKLGSRTSQDGVRKQTVSESSHCFILTEVIPAHDPSDYGFETIHSFCFSQLKDHLRVTLPELSIDGKNLQCDYSRN